MEQQQRKTITVLSYNVCFSRRAVGEFSSFTWGSRGKMLIESLKQNIEKNKVAICMLQEVHQDYIKDIDNLVKELGWKSHSQEYSRKLDQAIFLYTLYNPQVLELKSTPESSLENVSFIQESVFAMMHSSQLLWTENVHLPMEKDKRPQSLESLIAHLETRASSTRLVTGDFNVFPDKGGFQEMERIKHEAHLNDVSQFLISLTTKKRSDATFYAYPFDNPDPKEWNNKLDFVLSDLRGLDAWVLDELSLSTEKGSFGLSDHFPIVVNLSIE